MLIIDDDESDQLLMSRAIARAGFEVEISAASSGDEGIEKALKLKPAVVIVDGSLPGMDGFQACAKIKAATNDLKIIVCSGFVDQQVINKARSAGADECCLKTADYGSLINAITHVFV